MPKVQPQPELPTRVLRLRVKDKHAAELREMDYWVNQVWNYYNALSAQVFERERRFLSGYDLQKYTAGATKEGVPLHSGTLQLLATEYATRRRQFKKTKLRWRVSGGARRSLGWVPLKASAVKYTGGQLRISGMSRPLSLWDSYGLASYQLRTATLSEDARGRWYINLTVQVQKKPRDYSIVKVDALGIDLGLKDFFTDSEGNRVEAPQFYRDLEPKLATAQRAGKTGRVRALHAKIAHRRKDFLHKLSTQQVRTHQAIFVGDVEPSRLAKTRMAKSVLDAGWSAYRTMLQYKGNDAGVWFKAVNESYSTQECSACHARTGPTGLSGLSVRRWTCVCGAVHDRDVNSAVNIKHRGLEWLAQEMAAAQEAKAEACAVNEVPSTDEAAAGHGRPAVGILVL